MKGILETIKKSQTLMTMTLLSMTLLFASCGKSPENKIVKDVSINSILEDCFNKRPLAIFFQSKDA